MNDKEKISRVLKELNSMDERVGVVKLRYTDSMGNRTIVRVDGKDNSVVAYTEDNRSSVSLSNFMSMSGEGHEKDSEEFRQL